MALDRAWRHMPEQSPRAGRGLGLWIAGSLVARQSVACAANKTPLATLAFWSKELARLPFLRHFLEFGAVQSSQSNGRNWRVYQLSSGILVTLEYAVTVIHCRK